MATNVNNVTHLPVFDKKADLEFKNFATLAAIQGNQFGKDVYTSVMKFKDLQKFLKIFPEVQRDIVPSKVASIRRYILGGLKDRELLQMRFFPAMTVTCKSTMFYDKHQNKVAIDTVSSKLSINDGQHRFEAIRTALEVLEQDFVKSKDKEKSTNLQNFIHELREMVIPIVIFDGLSVKQEKQLFHDQNNLASRPSRNANIRLNQTDLFSRMARELAESNKYFKHYGVEVDKMSISGSNPNTILLSTIYVSAREILGSELKYNNAFLNANNYEGFKKRVDDTFSQLFYALPPDIDTRGKYLTDKSYTIKAICRFICHARNHLDLRLSDEQIFKIISEADWTYNLAKWSRYSGINSGKKGNIVFGGGEGGGFKAVYKSLMDTATGEDIRASLESAKKR